MQHTMKDTEFAELVLQLGNAMQEHPHYVAGYLSGDLTIKQIQEVVDSYSRLFGQKVGD